MTRSSRVQPGLTPIRSAASAAVILALTLPACRQDSPEPQEGFTGPPQGSPQQPAGAAAGGWVVDLREADHRTIVHPEKRFYVMIWPDGPGVSFNTAQGHFGNYSFPRDSFPVGEGVYLRCPGSPDLLPLRVVRQHGREVNQVYRVEWLREPPAADGSARVVRSY